jgi:hypothetical protein
MQDSSIIDKSLSLLARSQPKLSQATSAHAAEHRRGTLLSSMAHWCSLLAFDENFTWGKVWQ